ncbi:MAG: hypothetical protein H6Q73_1238 [Firmicutes bacterium]|nr:hypothetical protein [Bacillota bacterium]
MIGWTIAIVVTGGLGTALYVWFRSRNMAKRYDKIASRVKQIDSGWNNRRTTQLLDSIYRLIDICIATDNAVFGYKAIDLLKIAFSEGVIRNNESPELAGIIIAALRREQPDIAAGALDAFRQLLKNMPSGDIYLACEQLTLIAAISYRENYYFLAAKAAEVVFVVMDRREDEGVMSVLSTIKIIGILALRRRDNGLFRELTVRLADAIDEQCWHNGFRIEVNGIVSVWLHRIIKNDDAMMLAVLTEFVRLLLSSDNLTEDDMNEFIREWYNSAGIASLNPNSDLAAKIIAFTLKAILNRCGLQGLDLAVNGAGQVVRLVISREGIKNSFPYVLPLLDTGRELLARELKFGSGEYDDSFRQRALFSLVRELIAIARYATRQGTSTTVSDVITEYYQCWLVYPEPSSVKAIKRFCQLIIVYWLRVRTRQEKKMDVSGELALPMLLDDREREKLAFF